MTNKKSYKKNKSESNYFILPNKVFFGEDHELLNIEEIFLYSFLLVKRNFAIDVFETNFKFIADHISFTENKKRNRDRIEQHLRQLDSKGYLTIKSLEIIEIRENSLTISFPEKVEPPFTQVPLNLMNFSFDSIVLAILLYIQVNAFKTNEISYNEFRKRLLSIKGKAIAIETVKTRIKKLEEDQILTITRGSPKADGNGNYKQETNKYEINLREVKQKTINDEITEIEAEEFFEIEADNVDGEKTDGKLKQEAVEYCKRLPRRLNEKLYVNIHLHENPYVLEYCQKRFERMKEKGFNFSRWDKAVQKERNYREKQKRENERWRNSSDEYSEHDEDEIKLEPVKRFPKGFTESEEIEEVEAMNDVGNVDVEYNAVEFKPKKEAPQENDDWILEMLDEENVIDENDDDFDDDDFDEDEDFIVEENHDDYDFLAPHFKHNPEYKKFANMKFMKYMGMN